MPTRISMTGATACMLRFDNLITLLYFTFVLMCGAVIMIMGKLPHYAWQQDMDGSRLPVDPFIATAMIKIEETLPSSDLTFDENQYHHHQCNVM